MQSKRALRFELITREMLDLEENIAPDCSLFLTTFF